MSDVAETLSTVALLDPNKEPTTITDLPAEIKLQIYRYLDSSLEITAMNSTSRMLNWIWRINAASISSAVLSRSIEYYGSALELFEVEERVKQIHCIILPQSAVLKRVRVAQKQARDIVRQGCRNNRCDHTSSDVLYRGVLYRNDQLLSAAKDASYVLGLIENRVVYSGGSSPDDFDSQIARPSQTTIVAYHQLIILIRLRLLEAMQARLKTMGKKEIRRMLHVATYFVYHCPDKDKIRLGISRKIALRNLPWVIDGLDLDFIPKCHVTVQARRAFFAIANAVGDAHIPNHLLNNRSGCRGDCENLGEIVAK